MMNDFCFLFFFIKSHYTCQLHKNKTDIFSTYLLIANLLFAFLSAIEYWHSIPLFNSFLSNRTIIVRKNRIKWVRFLFSSLIHSTPLRNYIIIHRCTLSFHFQLVEKIVQWWQFAKGIQYHLSPLVYHSYK
jgi:hypothetical protein